MEVKHSPIPTDGITHITITSVPIPIEFGIPEASLPETENIKDLLPKALQRKLHNSTIVVKFVLIAPRTSPV